MPIYEYRCEKGHEFETFQSMSEDPISKCMECGAPAQRVLSAPAVHFKGSGFYTTDYGKGKKSGGSDSSSSSSEKSSSGSSGSSSGDSSSSKSSEKKGSDSKSSSSSSSSSD